MENEIYDFINGKLSPGSTILELGTGESTGVLAERYKVYAIEDIEKWVGYSKKANYLHVPLKEYSYDEFPEQSAWYDVDILKDKLYGIEYDLIIIDGPAGKNRSGFYVNLDLFDASKMMIFHDTQRDSVMQHVELVSEKVGREVKIIRWQNNDCPDYPYFAFIDKA